MKRFLIILLAATLGLGARAEKEERQDTLRVLAVGNSFSQDAVEQYLWNLADSAGIPMIIGNMYIGGCTLERHVKNTIENLPDYEYRKVTDGTKVNYKHATLDYALANEPWDVITVQQASGYSGIYESYHPYIDSLLVYIKAHAQDSVQILFHQTWAYQNGSTHPDFPKYGCCQDSMYHAIMETQRRVMEETGLTTVIPCGTAVQNARTSFIGDNMTRDGYHMNLVYGRYTTACTWFEVLTHQSVLKNTYAPKGMTPAQIRATRLAAHMAVKIPWQVTRIIGGEMQ